MFAVPLCSSQIESNFGNYQQFLSQALMYLDSPHKALKGAAMRFIGRYRLGYFKPPPHVP